MARGHQFRPGRGSSGGIVLAGFGDDCLVACLLM